MKDCINSRLKPKFWLKRNKKVFLEQKEHVQLATISFIGKEF